MTALMTVLAAGGTLSAAPAADHGRRPALVIDAALGRHGRDLVDPALTAGHATLRLPRTPAEARTDVRYLQATGHRVTAVGPESSAALKAATRGAR